MKKTNQNRPNYYSPEREYCERCGKLFNIFDLDKKDGRMVCGECEQEITEMEKD